MKALKIGFTVFILTNPIKVALKLQYVWEMYIHIVKNTDRDIHSSLQPT